MLSMTELVALAYVEPPVCGLPRGLNRQEVSKAIRGGLLQDTHHGPRLTPWGWQVAHDAARRLLVQTRNNTALETAEQTSQAAIEQPTHEEAA